MAGIESIAKSDAEMHVRLDAWGKAILEEVLLQAALQVSERVVTEDSVNVSLSFTLTPRPESGCIEISTAGAIEKAIVTQLRVVG